MKNLSLIIAFALIFGITFSANAQSKTASHDVTVGIAKHSLIGISSVAPITLTPDAPTTAGEGLKFDVEGARNNSVWLNYSSIVGSGSNSISVAMTGNELPAGVTIELVAAEDAGAGNGKVGQAHEGAIVLSNSSQELISNIKNCYTGTGSSAGHQLTYTLKMDNSGNNYESLTSGNFTNTITYTITDN